MNILPKKRWHVRTKENIARVRKDEAEAAEKTRLEQDRVDKAESEARLNLLRKESRRKLHIDPSELLPDIDQESIQTTSKSSKHINFFEELEQGNIDYSKTNKDFEKEKKEEQEKYEKQIGLLTYLGQGIKEAVSKSWYNELPKRIKDEEKTVEIKPHKKSLDDPMQDIKKYLKIISLQRSDKSNKEDNKNIKSENIKIKEEAKTLKHADMVATGKKRKRNSLSESDSDKEIKIFKSENLVETAKKRKCSSSSVSEDEHKSYKKYKKHKKHKHKKHKKHKKSKNKELKKGPVIDIQKLRIERLEREKEERLRTQALLAQTKGQSDTNERSSQSNYRQKYNSQFFPQLARQNCEKTHR